MGKTLPGGFYIGADRKPHDAWGRELALSGKSTHEPVDLQNPNKSGIQAVGGQHDFVAPGSDLARDELIRIQEQEASLAEQRRAVLERVGNMQQAEKLGEAVATALRQVGQPDAEQLSGLSGSIGSMPDKKASRKASKEAENEFRSELEAMKKDELVELAKEKGIEASGTKDEIIDALVKSSNG